MKYSHSSHVQVEMEFGEQRVVDFDNERPDGQIVIIRDGVTRMSKPIDPKTGHPLPQVTIEPTCIAMSAMEAKRLMDVLTRMFTTIPQEVLARLK